MDGKKDRIMGVDFSNGEDMTAIAWGHRKGDTYYISTIGYSEVIPPEFLLALDFDYETERMDVSLVKMESLSGGIEEKYDSSGRVIVRHPYVRDRSVKFAHSLLEKHDRVIRMLNLDRELYHDYRRKLGLTINFRENVLYYREMEEHIKDLYETYDKERAKKEMDFDDRSLFKRSSSTEGMQFRRDSKD